MKVHKVLKTRDRVVRYSMHDFIAAVRARPQLWGRHHPDYHNRDRRELAWHDVARCLYNKFDAGTAVEKQRIVVMLTKRWKNTRDSFFRSHRRNRPQKEPVNEEPMRTYIYEQQMSFLLHHNDMELAAAGGDGNNNNANAHDNVSDSNSIDLSEIKLEKEDSVGCPLKSIKRPAEIKTPTANLKKSRMSYSDNSESDDDPLTTILKYDESEEFLELSATAPESSQLYSETPKERAAVAVNSTAPETTLATKELTKERTAASASRETHRERAVAASSSIPKAAAESDPDQSFFDSIKPVIRSMDMDQKLDFQIEVLKLLKNFRGKN